MKKIISFFAVLLFAFILVACNESTVKHKVTFDSVGGSSVESVEVEVGGLVERPTDPKKDDHTFKGWFKDSEYKVEWKFATDKVSEPITLYAKWEKVSATIPTEPSEPTEPIDPTESQQPEELVVTFDFNYTGASRPVEVTVNKGEKIAVADIPVVPERENFEFLGWSTSKTAFEEFDLDEEIMASVHIYAYWESTLEYVTVTFVVEGEADVVETIVKGTKVDERDVPTPSKEGFNFVGWFDSDDEQWNFAVDVIEADLVVTAKFVELTEPGVAISTPEALAALMTGSYTDPDERYYLTNDIDMTGFEVEYDNGAKFSGEFDGKGFTIKNLVYHSDATNAKMGLFKTANDAVIKDLFLDNVDIKSVSERAGLLVGEVDGPTVIENVHITNSKVFGNQGNNSAGGLVGYSKANLEITNVSLIDVEIEGEKQGVGGLIGRATDGIVNFNNIVLDITIKGNNRVGGLIGDTTRINGTTVTNVLIIADMTANTQHIGSLFGKGDSSNAPGENGPGIIIDSVVLITKYNGAVNNNIGYIQGDNNTLILSNSYIYNESMAHTQSGGGNSAVIVVENIHEFYDNAWWTTNLASLTAHDLWEADASGLYVLAAIDHEFLKPQHLLVTFDLGYDDKVVQYSVPLNGLIPNFIPVRAEFDFDGWKLGEAMFDPATPVTEDMTLVAVWSQTIYTDVTYKVDGEADVIVEDVAVGSKLTKPADPVKADHNFVGWHDGTKLWDFANDVVYEDLVLTAQFEAIVYGQVIYRVDGEADVVVENIPLGSKLVKPADPEKTGFIFTGWYKDGILWNFNVDTLEVESLVLIAEFEDASQFEDLLFEFYNDVNTDDFFTASTSTKTGMPPYELKEGVIIDLPLKFDSGGFLDFTTPQPGMTLKLVVRTAKDETGGRLKVNDVVYNLAADDFTIIEVVLDTAEAYHVVRDNKELVLYYASVSYTQEEDPGNGDYEPVGTAISTVAEFLDFLTQSSGDYYLANDIDFEGLELTTDEKKTFTGMLDGNFKTLKNLKRTTERGGLFRSVKGATFKNITFDNVEMIGTDRAGMLAGEAPKEGGLTTIDNITIINSKVSGNNNNGVGALVGMGQDSMNISNIKIINVELNNAARSVGAVMGLADGASLPMTINVSNVYVQDTTITGGTRAGFVIGESKNGAVVEIENVVGLNIEVISTSHSAGIIGYHNVTDTGTVKNVFINGKIDGGSQVGHITVEKKFASFADIYLADVEVLGTYTGKDTLPEENILAALPDAAWWLANLGDIATHEDWVFDEVLEVYKLK